MTRKWVVNASPLIILGKIGHLRLLAELASPLVIPASVFAEVSAGPMDDPAAGWLRGEGAAFIRDDAPGDAEILNWDLGSGESAVLALARREGFEAIVDDRAARRCAAVLNIAARGTLGVFLAAKRAGLVPSVKDFAAAVSAAGLYLDPSVIARLISVAGDEQ